LLAEALAPGATGGSLSVEAFALYTAAERAAGPEPDAAVDLYGQAVALARTAGASFVERVASVGLVRLWAARGDTARALAGYRRLVDDWRRSGHWIQLWTTLRNLVGPLAEAGQARAAALVLAAADRAPEAALVTVPEVAAELAGLAERLAAELGPDAMRAIGLAAAERSRAQVLEEALAAIDAALA
ncbi:MAG TPA: hypothetical protein VF743_05575, partial [Acidimicrobiales bacterium]